MAVASVQTHRVSWGGRGMRGKQEGPCRVQGPRSPRPSPSGPCGATSNCTRPAATVSAAPVARQKRSGPSRGVPHMPSVPPAPHTLLPHPQVQDWAPTACLPSTTALCIRPGVWAPPHRHWLRTPPAPGPGQGLASAARKRLEEVGLQGEDSETLGNQTQASQAPAAQISGTIFQARSLRSVDLQSPKSIQCTRPPSQERRQDTASPKPRPSPAPKRSVPLESILRKSPS